MLDPKKVDPFKEVKDYDWSESNLNSAWKEGWNIWECYGSDNGFLEIQRYDNEEDEEVLQVPEYLSCDQDAWDIVWNGSKPHHIKALEIIKEYNPLEYKCILKHINKKKEVSHG